MIRFLIPLILIALAVVLARRYIHNAPPDKQKSRKIDVLLVALTLVLLILTLMHRMHWLGAVATTLLIVGRKLLALVLNFYTRNKKENTASERHSSTEPTPSESMSEDEALKILGLQKPYSSDEVIEAHRKLMQKLHPDRGGNDYLAAKINEAKGLLQKKL